MEGLPTEPRGHILSWDETDVHIWLSQLGFPQYETQIRENNITGDILAVLDPEAIKEIGIATVGQRLAILKAVYLAKLSHNVPIEPDHYIPPSEADDRPDNLNVDRLYQIVKEQGERLRDLEFENRRLSENVQNYVDDLKSLRSSRIGTTVEDSPTQPQSAFKWQMPKSGRSPTKAEMDSPHPSPQKAEHDPMRNGNTSSYQPQPSTSEQHKSSPSPVGSSSQQQQPPPKTSRQESSDNLKSFKVSLEDPAWKVLPAALKKYKINNDDWQNYAMFICYGSTGNRIERCLSYDEKPLLLFQKLKDAKKNPVFMLKHIRDIRSPIAVAQQKQAARKASESPASGPSRFSTANSESNRPNSRPPKLQIHGVHSGAAPAIMTGVSEKPGWPEVISPSVETKERLDEVLSAGTTHSAPAVNGGALEASAHEQGAHAAHRDQLPSISAALSYAVAIYPYMAEQEDEFDVVVGDTFIIISRARGWWVVQRDPEGKGVIEPDSSKQGWVPAGCLLETSVPVASAIEEAALALRSQALHNGSDPPEPVSKTPILPLSILSTSFPGVALMEYRKKGEEELDLIKDDPLRVFKRYNHWSYAVKEDTGDRGWVPSWYIGKVAATPATPSMNASTSATVPLDGDGNGGSSLGSGNPTQPSPMSSAFPPMGSQARTTTVI